MTGHFKKELRTVAALNGILKTIRIPISILTASLLSRIVSAAGAGNAAVVLGQGAALLSVISGMLLLEIGGGILSQRLKAKALHRCKLYLYGRLAASPLASLASSGHGDTIENLHEDFGTVTEKIATLYSEWLTGIATFAAYLIFLSAQSWQMALLLAGMSLLQLIPPFLVRRFLQVNYDNCRDIEAQLTDFVVSGCEGFLAIKMYSLKNWWLGELERYHKKYRKIGSSSIYTGTAESTLEELVSMLLGYGVYGVTGVLVLGGYVPLETGIQAIALSGGLFGASKEAFSMIARFGVAKVAENRLESGPFSVIPPQRETAGISVPDISIINLSYSYGDKTLFGGAHAFFGKGRTVVIKGPNGTGKSTLLRLVAGMLRCGEGEIKVGGVAPENLSDDSFPRDIFYLPQEDETFSFPASELYRMSIPEAAGRAEELARELCLGEDLIRNHPIDSLSGGERKKVFLALAFAADPLLMLLDEPTNSLDEKGRQKLTEMVRGRCRSTVIVTHDSVFDSISEETYLCAEGQLRTAGDNLHGYTSKENDITGKGD